MSISFDLKQALETGNAILFVGAGMGYNMVTSNGDAIPDGAKLAQMIADNFHVPSNGITDLAKITQYVVAQKGGKNELNVFIRQTLDQALPDDAMMWIPTIRWKAIYTTNYDNCIEKAYDQCPNPAQQYIVVTHLSGIGEYHSAFQVPIIHLHGSLFAPTSPEILITQQDYIKYSEKRSSLFSLLKMHMASSCILYTGYSHNDSNFSQILSDVETEMYPEQPKRAYRVDPYTSELDTALLSQRNITTLSQSFTDFVGCARIEISSVSITKDNYKSYEAAIPNDYKQSFENNPFPTIRMLSAWDYVNQMLSSARISIREFLQGSKAEWNIICDKQYFQRTIESDIYETLIDHVTSPRRSVNAVVILAPAGYGTSTLLKALAKRLSDEKVAEVYFHKSAKEYREGDVLFACEKSPDTKHVFFIDNATSFLRDIKKTISHAAQQKHDCLFILGDRLNQWDQKRIDLQGTFFTIQPLDDVEIENLLDFLRDNHELNKLADLPRLHQVAAIKRNYNRELLVAIREATEGRNFDAIIQDEYFSIEGDVAKRAYAIVSCFHQGGALLRTDLLASLLSLSLIEMYDHIRAPLHGIVAYEDINDGITDFAIRSRHSIISTIVWNRCLSTAERDTIIHSSLENLNLAYRLDYEAFESFVFCDSMVDMLSSDESKLRFFEKACKMDPDNPYVKQHYARMLVRIKRYSVALGMIQQAISTAPTRRMLYHTKGYVLHNMALDAESIEIGRRYLGQSEEAYQNALNMNDKDAYCYQGLASLYLSWAKRDITDDERTLYLANAEEVIHKGLLKATDKEALWIESANIDEYVGNMPNRILSLERAVSNAPSSILSRYLLSKAYIANENYEKAEKLLENIVFDSPNEYRSAMEYAKLILLTKKDIRHAIAILEQSTLYGVADGRFMSMRGGLYFLDHQFSKATEVFNESTRREYKNPFRVLFNPTELGIFSPAKATVNYVGDGYSLVTIDGFPAVRCRSTKYNGVILKANMKIDVILEASPREVTARII